MSWTQTGFNLSWNALATSSSGQISFACVTAGRMYKSIDYGISWNLIVDTNNNINTNLNWSDIAISSDGTKIFGCVGTNGYIYVSIDSGVSWNATHTPDDWRGICSSNDGLKLAACAYNGKVHLSDDGGLTWNTVDGNRHFLSICCNINGNVISATEENGHIVTILNRGQNFYNSDITGLWSSITCNSDGSKIYASVNPGYLFISIDNGTTFTQLSQLPTYQWTCINTSNFGNGQYIAACINNGNIYISQDYGQSWVIHESARTWKTIEISSDGQIVNAGVNTGYIYNSTDGGISCICHNTEILMGTGETKYVQLLKIGDELQTTEGLRKILFIGYNATYRTNLFKIIPKNGYKPNIPSKDLCLSIGHSLLFNNEDIEKFKKQDLNCSSFYNECNTKIDNLNKLLIIDCNLEKDAIFDETDTKIFYYHIVLEHNGNINKQYGIYANNMLIETMSEAWIIHSKLHKLIN